MWQGALSLSEASLCHKNKPEPVGLEVSDQERPSGVNPAVPAETSDSNRVQPGSAKPAKINQSADLTGDSCIRDKHSLFQPLGFVFLRSTIDHWHAKGVVDTILRSLQELTHLILTTIL